MNKKEEKEFLSRQVFFEDFKKIIFEREDPLARMILQENYIIFLMSVLIFSLELLKHYSVGYSFDRCFKGSKRFDFLNNLPAQSGKAIPISMPKIKCTLGEAIHQLEKSDIDFFENKKIQKRLYKYKNKRDDFTHNILFKFNSFGAIKKEAINLTVEGDQIIEDLNKITETIQEKEKRICLAFYKNNPMK